MDALLIGYARVSTDEQHLTPNEMPSPRSASAPERIYVDQGLTGPTGAAGPAPSPLAACRAGDTLGTKLDRLARSLPDGRAIVEDFPRRQVKLSLGGRRPRPHRPGTHRCCLHPC